MSNVSSNWETEGIADGGVSFGPGYSISWQRGNVNEEERNGAFLTDILDACKQRLKFAQTILSTVENAAAIEAINNALTCLNKQQTFHPSKNVLKVDTESKHKPTSSTSIESDKDLKNAVIWIYKFKNAIEVIDIYLKSITCYGKEKSNLQNQKLQYEDQIATLQYDINVYKSCMNKNESKLSSYHKDFW